MFGEKIKAKGAFDKQKEIYSSLHKGVSYESISLVGLRIYILGKRSN